MYKKLLSTIAFCLVTVPFAFAQSGTLTGEVVDDRNDEPLPGVNIFIQELQRGAATNFDGEFTIQNIPYGTYTARVSFVGYRTLNQEFTISSSEQSVVFRIEEDLVGLGELIVTGQGDGVQRGRLSTTVTTISARQLERVPAAQLDQILQANLANSQVRMSSGTPGTASLLRGRGVVSAVTSTTPVIYIDGVRVDNTSGVSLSEPTGGAQSSAIADIPVENIERIEYVSGGAATTQFGSDAANGVIQIFTKRGVQGATQFRFQSTIGSEVGTTDFLKYEETGDILFEPGLVQEYRLSASGGTEDYTYSFSGSMRGKDGFTPHTGQVRHNLRTTLSAQLVESTRYTGSFGFTSSEYSRDWNANSSAGAFGYLEGGTGGDLSALSGSELDELSDFIHGFMSEVDNSEDIKRFQTSHTLDFDILPVDGLTAKAVVGLDYRNYKQDFYYTNAFQIARGFVPEGTTDQGFMAEVSRDFLGLTLEGNVRYETDFGDFSSITNIGGQLFRNDDRQYRLTGDEIPDGTTSVNNAAQTSAENFRRTVVNYGVYALENFGYRDTYFVELGVRADQNTAFGSEVNTQIYPKVGLIYNISNESFFEDNIPSNWISTFRIRGNYGWAGNFPTPFSNEVLASLNPFLGTSTMEFGTPGDVNLKPEKTETFEIGADLSFLNDRINFSATYYTSETTDALFRAPFARSTGLGSALQNLGVIENTGLELSSSFQVVSTRDASVSLRASLNTLESVVADNGNSAPFSVGGFSFLGAFVDEGYPVGYFRGNRPVFDDGGNMVDVIPNDDLGNALPTAFGNLGINADYRNFSLTVTADYQVGAQGVNVDEVLRFFSGLDDDRIPEASAGESFFDLAGVWVEDTDFLKVRLIGLNYRIPSQYYAGFARGITVGFSVSNAFNFYSSTFDPEITGAGIAGVGLTPQGGVGVGGFGYGTYSPPREFLGRVTIDF